LEDVTALPDPGIETFSRLLFADGSVPPASIETYVCGFWSTSSLFIIFAGRFLRLRTAADDVPLHQSGRTPGLWDLSDVYEIMIGPCCGRTGRYKEFQVAPDGRWFAAEISVDGDRVVTDDRWDVSIRRLSTVDETEKFWRAGLEIPWDSLGGFDRAGECQCNFYRATGKFHGDELLSWRPTGYGERCFHRPHLFGSIKLVQG
jgi:hypothetical protein